MANSTGGAYVPALSYDRTGATDTGGTYSGATMSGTTTIGSGAALASATLTTPTVSGPISDSSGQKLVFNPTAKTLTSTTVTSLADIVLADNGYCGGYLSYTVQVSDGTDFQALTGIVTYAAVSKGATKTLTITELATVQAKAVSSGTLTNAWTLVTGTGKATIKLASTTSLTTTFMQVNYTVFPILGAVTIL